MRRVLCVDDSEKARNLVSNLLTSMGFEVYLAEDGHSALEQLEKCHFDLIVLDLNMPQMSGFSFLEQIRRRYSFRLTPVVVLSARRESRDVLRASELEAISYILKPFDHQQFKQKIEELMSHLGPSRTREISLEQRSRPSSVTGVMKVSGTIIKVFDNGVLIETRENWDLGKIIQLESDLLTSIGIQKQIFKVQSIQIQEDRNHIKLVFHQINQEERQKLFLWIEKSNQVLQAH